MAKQALDGARLNAFSVDPDNLTIVGLDTDDGPEHPLYDPRVKLPVDDAMVRNIMEYGVQEPVLVRKNGDEAEVVDGRQRVRAAREANARLSRAGSDTIGVPTMVRKGDDAFVYGVMISTNELRRDDGIMAKAEKVKRLHALGKSDVECAIAFGVSKQTIREWAILLDLVPDVRKAVDRGEVSPTAAGKLAGLSREDQKLALATLQAPGAPKTVKAAEVVAKARKRPEGAEESVVAPSRRHAHAVLALDKKRNALDAGFVQGVLWMLGERASRSIPGLRTLEKELEGES